MSSLKSSQLTNSSSHHNLDSILIILDASAAVNAVRDHPITQNVTNGPVAQSVKQEASQTSNEFGGLVDSRQTPEHKAANGQSLTNYHSFFYTLLSVSQIPRNMSVTNLFSGNILVPPESHSLSLYSLSLPADICQFSNGL
jgi:hypothetical protein